MLNDQNMDAYASWDNVADAVEFTIQPNLEYFCSLVPYQARVLDFGCGYGRIAARLKDLGYANIFGYDQSARMIDRGRQLYPTLNLRHLRALPIPERDAGYDAVLCCAVLTAIPEREERRQVIDEFWRVLAPKGILYAVEFLKSSGRAYAPDGMFISSFGPPMKHFEKGELLGEAGMFSLAEVWEAEDWDLRGKPASVLHVLWRKEATGE